MAQPAPTEVISIAGIVTQLVAPLRAEQQRLVDLIATGLGSGQWPIFDFLDAEFERGDLDASAVLESLPRVAGADYSAVWCPHHPGQRPAPDQRVALTVLGLAHATPTAAGRIVLAFLAFLPKLADWRREQPSNPNQPRQLMLDSASSLATEFRGVLDFPAVPPRFLFDLMDREPATRGGGASVADVGTWQREIPRHVRRFASVRSIEDYTAAIVELIYRAPPSLPMAAPSPLDLVASLDYLDAIWRLTTREGRLFTLHSAQRAAQLAFPAQTENEFESRLTGLGEILRSVRAPKSTPRQSPVRDKPLNPLADYLVSRLPASEVRLRRAIDTLHAVIDARDGRQHTAAGSKGAAAFIQLGVGYPPSNWLEAWTVVAGRTIQALDAIREELAAMATEDD
jgi:hypothetical protein